MGIIYELARVFVPGKTFQPSLMFASKAPGVTIKHLIRLERIVRNKCSSLLGLFVNYKEKCF
jgi:hypothetical protein